METILQNMVYANIVILLLLGLVLRFWHVKISKLDDKKVALIISIYMSIYALLYTYVGYLAIQSIGVIALGIFVIFIVWVIVNPFIRSKYKQYSKPKE